MSICFQWWQVSFRGLYLFSDPSQSYRTFCVHIIMLNYFFIVNKLQFTSFIHESQIGRESMNTEVRLDFNIKKGEFCMVGLRSINNKQTVNNCPHRTQSVIAVNILCTGNKIDILIFLIYFKNLMSLSWADNNKV